MKTEREAHHTLSLLFKDVGIPNQMIMDGAKTQTLGKFRQTLIAELNKPNHIARSPMPQKGLYVNQRRYKYCHNSVKNGDIRDLSAYLGTTDNTVYQAICRI